MWHEYALPSVRLRTFVPPAPRAWGLLLPNRDGISFTIDLIERIFQTNQVALLVPLGAETWWLPRANPTIDITTAGDTIITAELLPWLAQQPYGTCPGLIAGWGLGGQGALRIAFNHPKRFTVLCAQDAACDLYAFYDHAETLQAMYETAEQCRQDTPGLFVQPYHYPPGITLGHTADGPYARSNSQLHEKLAALGIAHEYSPASARVTQKNVTQVLADWLQFAQVFWDRERRRLV